MNLKHIFAGVLLVFGMGFGDGSVEAEESVYIFDSYCGNTFKCNDDILSTVDRVSFVKIGSDLYQDENNIYYTYGGWVSLFIKCKHK